jgi:cell division septation protein DedD
MTTSSYGGSRSGPIQGIQLPEHVPLDMDLDVQMDDPIEFLRNTERPVTIRVENEAMMHISDPDLRRYKLHGIDSDGSSRICTMTPHDSSRGLSSYDPASSSRPTTLTDVTLPPSSRTNWETDEVIQPSSGQAASAGHDEEHGREDVEKVTGTGTGDNPPSLTLLQEKAGGLRWFVFGVLALLLFAGAAITGIVCGTGKCSSPDPSESPTQVPSIAPTPVPSIAPTPATATPTTMPPSGAPTETVTEFPSTAPPINSSVAPSSTSTISPTLPGTNGPTSMVPDLPPETLARQGDFTTPQGMAFLYVESYPGFAQLPDWRKRQIFSMATFYRSFNGHAWPLTRSYQWLFSSVHECEWASIQAQPCDLNQEMEFMGLLNDPDLTGSMPPEVALLTQLEELSVVDCGLVGNATTVLPDELASLTNLRLFSVEGNALSGEVPSVLTSFTNLQYLVLQDNLWTGTVPPDWSKLSYLRNLDLSNTGLTGSIPVGFLALTNLEGLNIMGTQLVIPADLCALTALTITADCGTIECCQ